MTTTTPDIATHRIFRDKLTALDLRAAQEEAFAAGLDVAAYRVEVEDYAQGGELLIARAPADTLSARAEALARDEEEHAAALRAAAAGGSEEARGLAELRALMAEGNARRTRARAQEAAFLAGYLVRR